MGSNTNFGFIKQSSESGITKILNYPIQDISLKYNDHFYPRKIYIEIFYKDQLIAIKTNNTFFSDYMKDFYETLNNMRDEKPDTRICIVLKYWHAGSEKRYNKKIAEVESFYVLNDIEENEHLINRGE